MNIFELRGVVLGVGERGRDVRRSLFGVNEACVGATVNPVTQELAGRGGVLECIAKGFVGGGRRF